MAAQILKLCGLPYATQRAIHVPQWYPGEDAHCIEPGCTAPKGDPFCQCGDRSHRVSHGGRHLSRIEEFVPIPEDRAEVTAALMGEVEALAELAARLATVERMAKPEGERLGLALRRIAAAWDILNAPRPR